MSQPKKFSNQIQTRQVEISGGNCSTASPDLTKLWNSNSKTGMTITAPDEHGVLISTKPTKWPSAKPAYHGVLTTRPEASCMNKNSTLTFNSHLMTYQSKRLKIQTGRLTAMQWQPQPLTHTVWQRFYIGKPTTITISVDTTTPWQCVFWTRLLPPYRPDQEGKTTCSRLQWIR